MDNDNDNDMLMVKMIGCGRAQLSKDRTNDRVKSKDSLLSLFSYPYMDIRISMQGYENKHKDTRMVDLDEFIILVQDGDYMGCNHLWTL